MEPFGKYINTKFPVGHFFASHPKLSFYKGLMESLVFGEVSISCSKCFPNLPFSLRCNILAP